MNLTVSMIEDVDHWFELLEEVKARLKRVMGIFLGEAIGIFRFLSKF